MDFTIIYPFTHILYILYPYFSKFIQSKTLKKKRKNFQLVEAILCFVCKETRVQLKTCLGTMKNKNVSYIIRLQYVCKKKYFSRMQDISYSDISYLDTSYWDISYLDASYSFQDISYSKFKKKILLYFQIKFQNKLFH